MFQLGIIHITDRHGDIIDEIPMSTASPILSLEWDKDGECLAILQDGNGLNCMIIHIYYSISLYHLLHYTRYCTIMEFITKEIKYFRNKLT